MLTCTAITSFAACQVDAADRYHPIPKYLDRFYITEKNDFGSLVIKNSVSSRIRGLSPDGKIFVGQEQDSSGPFSNDQAFIWFDGDASITKLGTLKTGNKGDSIANAISANGQVVVGDTATDLGDVQAFIWREQDGKMESLGTLKADNSGSSYAGAVSADGSVVVGMSAIDVANPDDSALQAFIWRADKPKPVGLGTFRADGLGYSSARAISADGKAVVGMADAENGHVSN